MRNQVRNCDRCGKPFVEPYKEYLCRDCLDDLGWNATYHTNADRIRSMTDEELAEHNVRDSLEFIVDYDWDETPVGEYWPSWKTSDGSELQTYEDAIEYEKEWLKLPYKEET